MRPPGEQFLPQLTQGSAFGAAASGADADAAPDAGAAGGSPSASLGRSQPTSPGSNSAAAAPSAPGRFGSLAATAGRADSKLAAARGLPRIDAKSEPTGGAGPSGTQVLEP